MTHWKKLTNPDYIGAYAIEDGKDLVLTIAYVRQESVIGSDGKKEECIVCHFSEKDAKPMILNVTNCKTISKLYGTPLIEQWAGKKVTDRHRKSQKHLEILLKHLEYAPRDQLKLLTPYIIVQIAKRKLRILKGFQPLRLLR